MARLEIRRKFDEIVAFAEVERFLDTPVKHYSSGMYVRLAFAVAAHLEPEILLVDEVLAVGDASFQKKSLGKMEEVSRSQGRTIIFVSHNLSAVQNLCSKGIYLHNGKVLDIGHAHDVVKHYINDATSIGSHCWGGIHQDNEFIKVESITISTGRSDDGNIYTNDAIRLSVSLSVHNSVSDVAFEITVNTIDGVAAFSSFSNALTLDKGDKTITCLIPKNTMNDRHYSVNFGISKNFNYFIVKIDEAVSFDVSNIPEGLGWQGEWMGVLRPKLTWEVSEA